MNACVILAAIMLISLVIYSLLGGADYGAGFWDLVCNGPRKQGQRDLIAQAIQPVWEANHIWLILLVIPFYFVLTRSPNGFESLMQFKGDVSKSNAFDPYFFGMAAGISFSLIA